MILEAPPYVVIEYPAKEAALAAYDSDGYQAVVGIRLSATTNGRAVIVDGIGYGPLFGWSMSSH